MTQNEMIDRVAQVLCDLDGACWLADQGRYRDRARMVIAAMREPTEAMVDAACIAWAGLHPAFPGEKPVPTAGDVVGAVFSAAIDAALATRSTST